MGPTFRCSIGLAFCFIIFASAAKGDLVFDDGGLHTFDSTTNDFIVVEDDSLGNPTGLTVNAPAQVNGADVDEDSVYVTDNSTVTINGGSIIEDVTADTNAILTINGGSLGDDVYAFDNAMVLLTQGTINDNLLLFDNASAEISGGVINDDIEIYDSAMATMTGGTIGEDVYILGGSLTISGGNLFASGDSFEDGIVVEDGFGGEPGVLTLIGTSFVVDGVPVTSSRMLTGTNGILSGSLMDGSSFADIPFQTQCGCGFDGTINLNVAAVPEPSTIGFFLVVSGVLGWRKRDEFARWVRAADLHL